MLLNEYQCEFNGNMSIDIHNIFLGGRGGGIHT